MSGYFIADDLSGALDAAAGFHHAGRRVLIALSAEAWPQAEAGEVVGITTETRNATATRAAEVVEKVIAAGKRKGRALLYKKIDSTLRGQVASELAALAGAMPEANLLFAPANPRVGRTVRDGVLLVHGVPVAQTEFAHDPICPVRESSIRKLLGGVESSRLTIVDAESDADLTRAVEGMEATGKPWVGIGSGALAGPVAFVRARGNGRRAAASATIRAGPVLFICGSAHPANQAQAKRLRHDCGIPWQEVNPHDVQPAVRATLDNMKRLGGATLMLERTRVESTVALSAIVTAARAVVTEAKVNRLFVTGGETAFSLCSDLQVPVLNFRSEVEPGLSLSDATGSTGALQLAVKPGGFGDETTWARALKALRG